MSECDFCDRKGIFLKTSQCMVMTTVKNRDVICGKNICNECLYRIIRYDEDNDEISRTTICPKHIYNVLMEFEIEQLEEFLEYEEIYLKEDGVKVRIHGKSVVEIADNVIDDKRRRISLEIEESYKARKELANNYMKAGRYEEAAKIFDEIEMWEEAGEARRRMKENVNKHIHINANDLFDRIKREGFAIPYKCPNCSGVLKVTGDNTSCPYCGSDLDVKTLSELFKVLLS